MKKSALSFSVIAALTLVALISVTSSRASAEEESGLKGPAKPDFHAADKLGKKLDDVEMMNDIEAADAVAYRGVENEAKVEAETLKRDIKRLEQQVQSLKVGSEQAKKSAELSQKKTDLVRQQNIEARKKVAATQKVKDASDREKQAAEQKLAAVEKESQEIEDQIKKMEQFIQMDRDDRKKIMDRATVVRAQMAQQRLRLQGSQEKHNLMKSQNKVLDEKVTKAEGRIAGQQDARGSASAAQQ